MKNQIIQKIKDLEKESNHLFEVLSEKNFESNVEWEIYKSNIHFLMEQIRILDLVITEPSKKAIENIEIPKQETESADKKTDAPKAEIERPISRADRYMSELKKEDSVADKLNTAVNSTLSLNKKLFFSRELFNNDKNLLEQALQEIVNANNPTGTVEILGKFIRVEELTKNKKTIFEEFVGLVRKK